MSREIKFRAWDIKNKKWLNAGQSLLGYLVAWKTPDTFEVIGRGDYELMQSTGLKDKNGVEIYEGDVVKAQIVNNRYRFGVIEFSGGAFRFNEFWHEGMLTMYEDEPLDIDFYYNHEILGNIYENPELTEENAE